MKRVPRAAADTASARYGLMPGDLTTTSNADSASAIGVGFDRQQRIAAARAASAASAASQNSVSGSARQARADRAIRGAAFAAPAPERDALAVKLRNAHAACPTAPAECGARRRCTSSGATRSSPASSCGADLAREAFDQRVLAPFRTRGQRRHRRARFAAFADALERLVVLVFQQRVVTGGLRRIVEQVAAEDADQPRLRHERRQREEHEVALRAHAAPAVGRALAEEVEVAVAAGEVRVVAVGLARTAARPRVRSAAAAASSNAGRRRRARCT